MVEPRAEDDEIEIPIWVGGCEKWLTGLTRRTTCDDVIYALLAHNHNPNRGSDWDVQGYAVFESWRGVERPLSDRTKIVKIWRTWGPEIINVKFCLRKLDNILDSSSEISRTRRHRKTSRTKEEKRGKEKKQRERERSRDTKSTKYSSSKDKDLHRLQPDHKYEKDRGHAYLNERPKPSKSRSKEKSKLFHRLVQLVIEQEKRIQEQLSRIQDLDSQIGRCESKIEEIETHKLNSNDAHAQNESGLFPKVKAQDMEAYLHMCESILELEDKITTEQDRIEDLSVCIQEESILECDDSLDSATAGEYSISTGQYTYSTPSGRQHKAANPNLPNRTESETNTNDVSFLKTELQRSISLSMAQQKQIHLVNRTLGECEKQLSKKREYINRLFVQLDTIEEESENDVYDDSGNVDSPPFSADNKDGRDSCDSGVQSDMLLDTDSLSPHSQTVHAPRYMSLPPATSLPSVFMEPNSRFQFQESSKSILPRIRRHMVPYKTYTAPSSYTPQPEQYTGSCGVKSPPSDDSDTGLSSLHSDEPLPILETLV